MSNYGSEEIIQQLEQQPPGFELVLTLLRGDVSWNPASTKGLIYGPATVTYVRHVDGGVDATADFR